MLAGGPGPAGPNTTFRGLAELVLPQATAAATIVEAECGDREQRARDLLDALPAAIYTTDAAGRITYYNEAAAALWGHRPRLGSSRWCGSWRLWWPDGTPMAHDACPMAVALRENRPIRGAEAVAERPDGTRVPFIPFPTPLRDAAGRLVGAVNMLVDITERKAAETALREREARLTLLAREVDHRAKNMLATVQAIARMTRAETVPAYVEALTGRLFALSRAHTLLADSRWTGADLRRLAGEELAAYGGGGDGGGGRVAIAGPPVALSPEAAQALALALHELATNAAKYGALSAASGEGRVAVEWSWTSSDDGGGRLSLAWVETGGPAVAGPPAHRGFGTGLVVTVVKGQLDGEIRFDWHAGGLACRMSLPRRKILGSAAARSDGAAAGRANGLDGGAPGA